MENKSTVFTSAVIVASIFAVANFSMISISPAQSAWAGTIPGVNGKIAFTSDRDGKHQIYVMNADVTGQTNLSSSGIIFLDDLTQNTILPSNE